MHDAFAQVVFYNKLKRIMPEVHALEKKYQKLMKKHGPRPEYWPAKDQEALARLAALQTELEHTIQAIDDLRTSVHSVLDKIGDMHGAHVSGVEKQRELAEQEHQARLQYHSQIEDARLEKRKRFLKR